MDNHSVSILIVDDDINYRKILSDFLKNEGYDVDSANSAEEAIDRLEKDFFNIIISDLKLPGKTGIELLKTVKSRSEDIEIIILTAFGSVDSAVSALKIGACDYLVKPLSLEELSITLKKLVEKLQLKNYASYFKREIFKKFFIGKSKAAAKVIDDITVAAKSNLNVLISGESGTGKELSANLLHRLSSRRDKPFIIVDSCNLSENLFESELFGHERGSFTGADVLKKGLLEYADKGTLFIDEIGEVSGIIQAKLLRIIDTKSFRRVGSSKNIFIDSRIITATNKNLKKMVEEGKFRGDLFYRISGFTIELPPLRERKEDIPYLAHYFMTKENKVQYSKPISQSALNKLMDYAWPGNVRELKNVIERSIVLSEGKEEITDDAIQIEIAGNKNLNCGDEFAMFVKKIPIKEIEEKYISYLLSKGHTRAEIADIIGESERSVYRKLAGIKI
ncbi:MAG: sigma-54-dependent Fis family transcriptional regulator [Candidatus Acidulodesulfobacterium acidiphilum]|uniref:Sigma-54-dependent Fis family transcriptional regulator n=1 Tax=Candidatus Acidulodesulfobacterium acidiphilum TaxID=2597224 RepID=A0A520XEC5_9DELT|nr:MAG: sigma-54-dependent Fis family transcriptional regulator [Candidatus Acidulodesulfobacterium acidiphilum]